MKNKQKEALSTIIVFLAVILLFSLLLLCGQATAGEIGGSYSVIKNRCQQVTVQWNCGNCGSSCGRATFTWPQEHTTSTRYFNCSKCKNKNKVTLSGKKWPCE
jgi:hypothetical protein